MKLLLVSEVTNDTETKAGKTNSPPVTVDISIVNAN